MKAGRWDVEVAQDGRRSNGIENMAVSVEGDLKKSVRTKGWTAASDEDESQPRDAKSREK